VSGAPPLLVVAGPTATGKTELAIRLAETMRREGIEAVVISADSRQVYRGLDIGTAKPGGADRARAPHHGLDLVEPDEPFSVADFAEHARDVLAALPAERGIAILAGGTGLYLRAVARGLDTEALPHDPATRERVERELAQGGLPAAAGRLAIIAPNRAARTDLRNPRRVARALELAELIGDGPPPAPLGYDGPVAWLGLDVDAATHAAWIANRARQQFDAGLVDEAAALRERFDPALPAFSAIGYREAWAVLDGHLTRDQAIEEDALRNVRFAKRQRTWFRGEPAIEWLDATADVLPRAFEAAQRLVERASPATSP
jgi:tRNA dimethylallyltransferase